MRRLGVGFLLSLAIIGSVSAQNGSKRVDLKEITDGKFRQVTAIGEMRSLPDGEHYTAMNKDRSMIIKYSYRWTHCSMPGLPVNPHSMILTDTISAVPVIISWFGGKPNRFTAVLSRRWCTIMTCAVTM